MLSSREGEEGGFIYACKLVGLMDCI